MEGWVFQGRKDGRLSTELRPGSGAGELENAGGLEMESGWPGLSISKGGEEKTFGIKSSGSSTVRWS
jgi:hypothetical protein